MRVVALVSFAGRVGVNSLSIARGAEFDLPEGVDWLQAGLVAPVGSTGSPTATGPAPHMTGVEHAIDPAPMTAEKRKRGKATI